MTDREMLELAAKAVELTEWGWMGGAIAYVKDNTFVFWNPLADDGDALRLAVKVGLAIYPPAFNGGWEATASVKAADGPFVDESFHHDHNETTRRAIVRAAAEIGSQLP